MKAASFTYAELLRCAKREAAMRRAVYDKRVKHGEMNIAEANREVALMDAIVGHFLPLARAEEEAARADEPQLFTDQSQGDAP